MGDDNFPVSFYPPFFLGASTRSFPIITPTPFIKKKLNKKIHPSAGNTLSYMEGRALDTILIPYDSSKATSSLRREKRGQASRQRLGNETVSKTPARHPLLSFLSRPQIPSFYDMFYVMVKWFSTSVVLVSLEISFTMIVGEIQPGVKDDISSDATKSDKIRFASGTATMKALTRCSGLATQRDPALVEQRRGLCYIFSV